MASMWRLLRMLIIVCLAVQLVREQNFVSASEDRLDERESSLNVIEDLGSHLLDEKSRYRVVLVRHGASEWNIDNRYTGWYDAKLAETGLLECNKAAEKIRKANLKFDIAYTSHLLRAIVTMTTILDGSNQTNTEVHRTWRLNERHYGNITGLTKSSSLYTHSFDGIPELMDSTHPYWNSIYSNPNYRELVESGTLPRGESLKTTLDRSWPYWNETILPQIKAGKRILIVGHKNSLRGFIKNFDRLDGHEAAEVFLPNADPIIYEFDEQFRVTVSRKFL